MKAPPFRYHAPRGKHEALEMLASFENSRLLAGGQSLVPLLNFRAVTPDHLIDLNRISDLRGVAVSDDVVTIGAMTRQCTIEGSDTVRSHAPLLQAALAHVGHRPTRNRGTLGGSLCHLDPSAELVTASSALDATLIVESSVNRTRRIAFDAWGEGYLTNSLQPDEMLVAVEYPLWPQPYGYAFTEYARRKGDFAIVGVAVQLSVRADQTIDRIAIAVGGCTHAPQRLTEVERALRDVRPDSAAIRNAARVALSVEAGSDPYVSADYRRHLARVLTERALGEALHRVREGERA